MRNSSESRGSKNSKDSSDFGAAATMLGVARRGNASRLHYPRCFYRVKPATVAGRDPEGTLSRVGGQVFVLREEEAREVITPTRARFHDTPPSNGSRADESLLSRRRREREGGEGGGIASRVQGRIDSKFIDG